MASRSSRTTAAMKATHPLVLLEDELAAPAQHIGEGPFQALEQRRVHVAQRPDGRVLRGQQAGALLALLPRLAYSEPARVRGKLVSQMTMRMSAECAPPRG